MFSSYNDSCQPTFHALADSAKLQHGTGCPAPICKDFCFGDEQMNLQSIVMACLFSGQPGGAGKSQENQRRHDKGVAEHLSRDRDLRHFSRFLFSLSGGL